MISSRTKARKTKHVRPVYSKNFKPKEKMKNKIYLIIFCIFGSILLIPSVFAFDFDNVGNYKGDTGTMTVKNAFGLGSTIADITLLSPHEVQVIRGQDRLVAWYELKLYENYDGNSIFEKIDTYVGINKIDKSITYKLADEDKTKIIEIPIYENVCDEEIKININGTKETTYKNCIQKQVGTNTQIIYSWENFNSKTTLNAGTYTIGLFADVLPNENVEWIPTMFSVEIPQWATWNETFSDGLVNYWKFDETSGTIAEDIYRRNNILAIERGTFTDDGIIKNMLNATTNATVHGEIRGKSGNTIHTELYGTGNRTLNLWTKTYDINYNGNQTIFGWGSPAVATQGFYLQLRDKRYNLLVDRTAGSPNDLNTGVSATTGWKMLTVTKNTTSTGFYINGIIVASRTSTIATDGSNIFIGYDADLLVPSYNGTLDEVGIWNRSLSVGEILDLYNSGSGLMYLGISTINVTLDSPTNNMIDFSDNPIFFSATYVFNETGSSVGNFTNTTLYIWKPDKTLFANNRTDITGATTNSSNLSISFGSATSFGSYSWNYYACGRNTSNGVFCQFADNNRTLNLNPFGVLAQGWMNTTADTVYEVFNLSLSLLSDWTYSVSLDYNGTLHSATTSDYSATQSNYSVSFDIPETTQDGVNKSIFWKIVATNSSGSVSNQNTTIVNQTISKTELAYCNASNNWPYINFTFKDETTLGAITALVDASTWTYWIGSGTVTKTLIFANTTKSNPSYAFCLLPKTKNVYVDLTFKYSNASYPQRTFSLDNQLLSNLTVTNQVLYLLGSTEGIYSTFSFYDSGSNDPISGVYVTIERQVGVVWIVIGTATSDATGSATFWVNPNFPHRITGSKTGYATVSEIVYPTQSAYSIFMGGTGLSVGEYRYKNIKFYTYPPAGRLELDTTYDFGINITANDGNIISCKIEIKNLTLSIVASSVAGCGAYGGNLSVSYNTGSNSKLFGYYYVDIGDGLELIKANDAWFMEGLNATYGYGGLRGFLEELKNIPEFGDTHNRQEFSRIIFAFFFMIIIIGIFTYFSGYELSNPGAALIIVWGFVIMYSIGGIFNLEGITPYSWWNQYWLSFIASFIMVGFYLNYIRKTS